MIPEFPGLDGFAPQPYWLIPPSSNHPGVRGLSPARTHGDAATMEKLAREQWTKYHDQDAENARRHGPESTERLDAQGRMNSQAASSGWPIPFWSHPDAERLYRQKYTMLDGPIPDALLRYYVPGELPPSATETVPGAPLVSGPGGTEYVQPPASALPANSGLSADNQGWDPYEGVRQVVRDELRAALSAHGELGVLWSFRDVEGNYYGPFRSRKEAEIEASMANRRFPDEDPHEVVCLQIIELS